MTNRNSFLLYTDRLEILDELSDEDAGKLFKAVVEYVKNGSEPPRGTLTSIAFRGVKNGIDVATENYNKLCLKNRENGKKGGRPKTEKPNGFESEEKKPDGYFGIEKETQKTLTKTDTIIDDEDYKYARAREDAIVIEIEGSLDRLRVKREMSDSVGKVIRQLVDRETEFTINGASVPRERFLKYMLELLQDAERNNETYARIVMSVTDAVYGNVDGKVTNPFSYAATVLYNIAALL